MEKLKYFGLLALIFCSMGLIYLTSQMKAQDEEIKQLIAPPPQIERYSAGLKHQIADLFWIRSLQDFDYCEVKLAQNLCKGNSWLSKMLLAAVTLDPDYEVVYERGSLALTVLVSDYSGASELLDRGVARFPKNWRLLYTAAYHASFEEKNFVKAAELYKKAGENGAPLWTFALAARLYTKEGQIEMGEKLIEQLKDKDADEKIIKRIKQRIEEFKREPKK